ncbi:Fic/DOC family protein [Albimonas pacifica]|uniref:protein adenylyltransferase n=1 Tax=Albimonas pacifica TaxID=1114924 RepID=A0A1I3DGV6_9RHOB|nr:Fic family protein [Albimonas pacifica]SFH85721.1 cell filamentation protein [Albimonas pacifica]
MSRERFEQDAATHAALFYPGTDVMVNLLGLRDSEELARAERQLVEARTLQLPPVEARQFDYHGFRDLHRHLFQDVYSWAGEERTYLTARGPAPFARPEYIRTWMDARFETLRAEGFLAVLDAHRFAWRAAEHVNEINACHPFVEGNGRVQRAWLRLLAAEANYEIEFRRKDIAAWNEASRKGFTDADHEPMARLIAARIFGEPVREEARRAAFLKSRSAGAEKNHCDRTSGRTR